MSDLISVNTGMIEQFHNSGDILSDASLIIEAAQDTAYRAVNVALLQRNWLLGKRIAEEELTGNRQDDYGLEIIKRLSKQLNEKYGKGFTKTNLYHFYHFYKEYPDIFQTASGKSMPMLTWSHYLILMRVFDKTARDWYEKEAVHEVWSVRTLQRNVESQYYYRLLKSQSKAPVENADDIDLSKEFYFVGRTNEEISLVCKTEDTPERTIECDNGWRGFRIQGILDFSLIGILSKLSGILAEHKIGIFAVSTFNTDYILVKEENFDKALNILSTEGYTIV